MRSEALDALPGDPPVICGMTAMRDQWAAQTERFEAQSTLLVVDEVVAGNGYLDRLCDEIGASGATSHVLAPGEPTSDSVVAAADAVRRADRPLVVAVGGGSVLDTAKLAAVVAAGDADVERYALGACPLPRGRPVVAVPTTAGTGSEVTRTCVLTTRGGRKSWVWGDELLPRLVVLDPLATVTMPAVVTATTGLDALAHAIEAVTGRRTDPRVASLALAAVALVLGKLPAAVTDGGDLDARQAMQEAATLAGAAIDAGGTGAAHAIGHALGTVAGVPHGTAVAVGLATVLRWNVEAVPEAYAAVAATAGRSAGELAELYEELLRACRFEAAVRSAGPLEIDVDELARVIGGAENEPMRKNNCRPVDDEGRHHLAEQTLSTWERLHAGGASPIAGREP